MNAFPGLWPFSNPLSGRGRGLHGCLGGNRFPYPSFNSPPWNPYAIANGLWPSMPNSFQNTEYLPFGDAGGFGQASSSQYPTAAMLWARGVSSPCFRHDHQILTRYGRLPYPAGDQEIDWRNMIEVQFDQFGVASHCSSTHGRMAPWRPNRYRYSFEEACAKLRGEITMLISRLGLDMDDYSSPRGSDYGDPSAPWLNGRGYSYPINNIRCVIRSQHQISGCNIC
jgi:hypothetical protein